MTNPIRMKLAVVGLTAFMSVACVDTSTASNAESEQESRPTTFSTPEQMPTVGDDQTAVDGVPRVEYQVTLSLPETKGCAEPSLIGEVDLVNERVGQPILEEVFGDDGCIDERWVREWNGEAPLLEFYDFFEPELERDVYVLPISYTEQWTYDEAGREISRTRFQGESTDAFFEETIGYDANGNAVERAQHFRSTAGVETRRSREWSYRPDGQLLESRRYYDGELSSTVRHVYDGDGNPLEHWEGHGGEEILVTKRSYEEGVLVRVLNHGPYSGQLVSKQEIERRADGTKSRSVTHNYRNGWLDIHEFDEEERLVEYTQDSDLDGRSEYRKTHRYDDDGNMSFTSTSYNFDAAGNPGSYSEKRWDYDDRGRLLRHWDSLPGRDTRRTIYSYNEGDAYTVTIDRLRPDGSVHRPESVTRWADPDRMLWRRTDNDRDGVLEAVTINRWNGEQPRETLKDSDGDGTLDYIEQWLYDAAGQLAEQRVDHNADGIVDHRVSYQR